MLILLLHMHVRIVVYVENGIVVSGIVAQFRHNVQEQNHTQHEIYAQQTPPEQQGSATPLQGSPVRDPVEKHSKIRKNRLQESLTHLHQLFTNSEIGFRLYLSSSSKYVVLVIRTSWPVRLFDQPW